MKKVLLIIALLSLVLCALLLVKLGLSGETEKAQSSLDSSATEDEGLSFSDLSGFQFLFTSGAGGWGTMLNIEPDGSFSGEYHDSEYGQSGVDYDGSVYISKFKGTFSSLVKIDDNTYSMEVISLTTEDEPDTEEILEGMRFVYTLPFGIEEGGVFKVHLPDIDVSKLGDEFKMWAKGSYYFEGDILPVMALETEMSKGEYYEIAVFTQQK